MAFQNFYSSKITNAIGAGDVTITVDNAPTATSGRMVLEARNPTQREIIKYTSVAGNVLTGVTRGQGGTTAKSHVASSLIQMNATSEDLQDLYDAFASFSVSANDWRTLVPAVTGVTANGNRSYDITFASTVAAILSNGMRLRTTRTVAAPTQCTSLNGTTQYYSCASATVAADFTFTDDFAAGAWVKLSSYGASSMAIASRTNGTSGWIFYLEANTGQVVLSGYNGSLSNASRVTSYQSIPLNKWVHVSAQLDMSTFTATTTTSYVMIDGVDVPSAVSRTGSNPTALIQAGDLQIGAYNGASGYFPGKIAQAWISSAKVTQANVRTLYSQGLTSALITANNIVSAYDFNGNKNDLNTTSANNLTANGSAVETEADSFAGQQADGTISTIYDYAIVMKVNGTVATVQVPEGNTIPTSGGITAVSYSGVKAPYGFPDEARFPISAWDTVGTSTSSLAQTMAQFVTSTPIDGIKYGSHAGGAGGGYVIFQTGQLRRLLGKTASMAVGAGGSNVGLPANFFGKGYLPTTTDLNGSATAIPSGSFGQYANLVSCTTSNVSISTQGSAGSPPALYTIEGRA